MTLRLAEFVTSDGVRPFTRWFDRLDPVTAARINIRLERLADGNVSNSRGVGGGVHELKLDFGPGYRVYFGREGSQIVVLLGGGSKRRQSDDIEAAADHWKEYKRRRDSVWR